MSEDNAEFKNDVAETRAMFGLPQTWSDEAVMDWLAKADTQLPIEVEVGVFVYDPTRTQRKVGEWSTQELLAYLKGKLKDVPDAYAPKVISEYGRREPLEAAWSVAETLAYFREDIEPPKTPSGVWINDITRSRRRSPDWTNEELIAWAHDEIKAVGQTTDIHLAKELHQRMNLPGTNTTVDAVKKIYLASLLKKPDVVEAIATAPVDDKVDIYKTKVGALSLANVQFIESTLSQYETALSPTSPINDTVGGKQQRNLENLFQYIFRLEGRAMAEALDKVRNFVKKHRNGLFSPNQAHRFIHLLKADLKVQRRHSDLIELFVVVTDPNQQRRKQTDIRGMLRNMPVERKELLLEYFTTR